MTDIDSAILLPMPGLLYGVYLPLDAEGNVSDQFEPRLVVIHAQRRTGNILSLLHDGPEAAPLVLYDGSADKSRMGTNVQPTFAGIPVYPSVSSATARLKEMYGNLRRARQRLEGVDTLLLTDKSLNRR